MFFGQSVYKALWKQFPNLAIVSEELRGYSSLGKKYMIRIFQRTKSIMEA